MNELKPCPFCGGEAELIPGLAYGEVNGYECGCCDCNFTCGLHDTEEESVEHWNTRTVDVDKLATVANSLAVQEDPYCRDMADKIRKAAGL